MMEIWLGQQPLEEKILTRCHELPISSIQSYCQFLEWEDVIIGTVAAVMSSMIAVSIDYINGRPTTSKVECICATRNLRIRNVALVNDIVTLKILNHLNGTIHAGISEPNLGVLFTKCRKCGGTVIPMRDAIKCTECSWIDERKLSANFGNSDFINLRE